MNKDKYFLPDSYKERDTRTTMAEVSGHDYWNARRVGYSRMYQFHVYLYVAKLIREKGLKSLIDVGCGPASKLGRIHKLFPELSITGIDQKDAVDYCKNTHDFGEWHIDDFENPDPELANKKGDIVISVDVIEHLLNPDKLLEYCRSRLNDGGYILLSTPDRNRLHGTDNLQPKNPDHVREWNDEEFAEYLKSRGYKIIKQFHQVGIKPGINKLFARVMFNYIFRRSPKNMHYTQLALIQPE